MAVANLYETVLNFKLNRNRLNLELTEYQDQKLNATYAQADAQSLKNAESHSVRDYFKSLFEEDETLQGEYTDYTEIPEFEEEIDKITAKYQDMFNELTAWETSVDAQITTASAELEEVNACLESYSSMLSSNLQEDYDYGLK